MSAKYQNINEIRILVRSENQSNQKISQIGKCKSIQNIRQQHVSPAPSSGLLCSKNFA